ncbi:hypothetical protein [Promicromonospora xylanilytica]
MDGVMFGINPIEMSLVVLWFAGIAAAIFVGPMLSTQRRRIGLVVVAVVLPVLGSLVALVVAGGKLWVRRESNLGRLR